MTAVPGPPSKIPFVPPFPLNKQTSGPGDSPGLTLAFLRPRSWVWGARLLRVGWGRRQGPVGQGQGGGLKSGSGWLRGRWRGWRSRCWHGWQLRASGKAEEAEARGWSCCPVGETDAESAPPWGGRWAEEGPAGRQGLGSVVRVVNVLCGDGRRITCGLRVWVPECRGGCGVCTGGHGPCVICARWSGHRAVVCVATRTACV